MQVKLQKGTNGYQTAEQISLEQIRKKNEEALIQLSANKLNVIISGLAEGLDALSKVCYFSFLCFIHSFLHFGGCVINQNEMSCVYSYFTVVFITSLSPLFKLIFNHTQSLCGSNVDLFSRRIKVKMILQRKYSNTKLLLLI